MERQCRLQVLINGRPYPVNSELHPRTSLLTFIRDCAILPGTKSMCLEGGCGACIVTLKTTDPASSRISYRAVNSCLFPALSALDSEVITIEGLSDRATVCHPIQKRLAKFNGTQCGYCTPGMIMNMFSLTEDNPMITMKEVEESFGGNICRCTGYRPILDAFKSLAADAPEGLKCQITDIEELSKCQNSVCSLQRCGPHASKIITSCHGTWYRPSSMGCIMDIFKSIGTDEYMLLGGNTAHGIYRTSGDTRHFIDVNGVRELKQCRKSVTHLHLGGGTTLTDAIRIFDKYGDEEAGFNYLKTLRRHFELIANVPVRNVGTIAGNLATKHKYKDFPSDVFLTLETVGAQVVLERKGGENTVSLIEFLEETLNKTIIKSILLPRKSGQHRIRTFKIMPRAQNAHALVNAGFQFQLNDSGTILERPVLVFGGISRNFVHAGNCEQYFENAKIIDNETLYQGLTILRHEINPEFDPLKTSVGHRRDLAVSLLYKYILGIAKSSGLSDRFSRGSLDLERPLSTSSRDYGYVNEKWPKNGMGPKIEGIAQCTGHAQYVNDIPPMPGQLFAAFVLGREANAALLGINPRNALEEPGVVAFFSAKDIPGRNVESSAWVDTQFFFHEQLFSTERIRYAGQPVGVIVAETVDAALRASQLVELKTRPSDKPPILTCRQALNENSLDRITRCYEKKPDNMEIDRSRVVHTITGEHELGPQYHFTMEPQSCVCVPSDTGLDVFSSTQWIHGTQMAISTYLNIPLNKINLKVKRLGGGFGSKISRSFSVASACALAAVKLNRPVRMVLNIETNMEAIGKRNPAFCTYQASVDVNGKIINLNLDFYSDIGINGSDPSHFLIPNGLSNIYDTSSWHVRVSLVTTDTPSCSYMRGPGNIEGVSVIETVMDHIASVTGLDPLEVRMVNISGGDEGITCTISSLLSSSEYKDRRRAIQEFNSRSRWIKKGIAFHATKFPLKYFFNYHSSVSIYAPDGSVSISHGGVEMGQGLNTKVAEACAYTLGIDLSCVSIQPTNNHDSPNNSMAGASMTSESCVYATIQCCQTLLERLKPIRESIGETASWSELITKAWTRNVDLNASFQLRESFIPQPWIRRARITYPCFIVVCRGKTFNPKNLPFRTYATYGASVIELELDVLTGKYQISRADVLEDAGKSLSPEIDMGQIEGAFVMGLGYFLLENIVYDSEKGNNLTNRTWHYWPPGALDIPADFRVTVNGNMENPGGVLRSKSVGEPPICLAVGAVSAIREAIRSAREDAGLKDLWVPIDQPCSVEKVFNLLETPLKDLKLEL